jgi:REP element-mobilizing transposase RayT
MTYSTWDDNEFPLAYLITFRTYGTWLHGDGRSSVDLRGQNVYRAPRIQPNSKLLDLMNRNMGGQTPFILDGRQRSVVESAVRDVCLHRRYSLLAINVRTNHVHTVIAANSRPESIATTFKSYATRALRSANAVDADRKIWSRGESTRYLWKELFVDLAIAYVVSGQGDGLPDF